MNRTRGFGLAALAALIAASAFAAELGKPQPAKIERLDPAINAIVPEKATLQKVAGGFTWTEGPVWIHAGYLLFAEITSDSIREVTPAGGASIFIQPSGYKGSVPYGGPEPGSNGMTLDSKGRLTVAGHAGRTVWRLETLNPKGHITILADSYQGRRLNSPNDLVYRSDGSLYFTDPPYGLRTQDDTDPEKQLKVNGVYRIPGALQQAPGAQPDRAKLQMIIQDLPRPNGIAFSPDEKYLYVSDSGKEIWMKYTVQPNGSVTDGRLFADASGDKRIGGPDGIKVDRSGNLYGSGPGGVWILSPEGKHLGTIDMPEKASNIAWGGTDARTLYITDSASVYRITLKIPGVRP